ncbi:MAG: hypothetical protein KJ630_13075 [Proteobacteria bacterium]|nr:hypothetical protein [Pseudomonadota bacterium]
MMKHIGVKVPHKMLNDLGLISQNTGISKSFLIRQGILTVIAEFYRNEAIKQKNQEKYENKRNAARRGGEWVSLPDEW